MAVSSSYMDARSILSALRDQRGVSLPDLPGSSGIYTLRDHKGSIRYFGIAHTEGFRIRIRNKHATGSEDRSHKFSAAYNSGRLWRDRHSEHQEDGAIAKRVRNQFILTHCSASVFPIADYASKASLEALEASVIQLASADETIWNRKFKALEEPKALVDALINAMRLGTQEIAAIERQESRFRETSSCPSS